MIPSLFVLFSVNNELLRAEKGRSQSLGSMNKTINTLQCGPGYLSRCSDSLRAGRSGDWIPMRKIFSAPVHTGSVVHPACYTMGTGSFPWGGGKRPGSGVDHPPSSAEIKERVELYLYSTSGPSWPVLGWDFPLSLPLPLPLPSHFTFKVFV